MPVEHTAAFPPDRLMSSVMALAQEAVARCEEFRAALLEIAGKTQFVSDDPVGIARRALGLERAA